MILHWRCFFGVLRMFPHDDVLLGRPHVSLPLREHSGLAHFPRRAARLAPAAAAAAAATSRRVEPPLRGGGGQVRLARRILRSRPWPRSWCNHWILPLFKRGSRASPGNYRGIHLRDQLSKVRECVLCKIFIPHLQNIYLMGHMNLHRHKVTALELHFSS